VLSVPISDEGLKYDRKKTFYFNRLPVHVCKAAEGMLISGTPGAIADAISNYIKTTRHSENKALAAHVRS